MNPLPLTNPRCPFFPEEVVTYKGEIALRQRQCKGRLYLIDRQTQLAGVAANSVDQNLKGELWRCDVCGKQFKREYRWELAG